MVLELAEVLLAEAIERGAVELRRTAHEVVHLRLERSSLAVVPGVRRHVAVVEEDLLRQPVLRLARQPVASLEQQDPLSRRREVPGERASARAGSDDDDVVALPQYCPIISGRMIRAAASIRARWENAWGKLPRCLPVSASNSSAYRPSGEAIRSSFSIRSRACCISPTTASADTSQKEQMRKVPSLPDRPSSVLSVL